MPLPSLTARLQGAGASLPRPRVSWRPRRTAPTGGRPTSGAGPIHYSGGRRRRLVVLLAVVLVVLLVIVYLAVRMSGLSAVKDVTIIGVHGPEAAKIRAVIDRASRGQSTLGFDDDAVRSAVARDKSITGIDARTRFPHGVQIEVHQRLAVGVIESGGRKISVAADGTLLPDWPAGKLPVIRNGRASGNRIAADQQAAVTILGAAPTAILGRVARIDQTTIVRLADGPALLFRDTHRVNAKWAAAIAVLSDPKTTGATWIDLRIPEQPVAGSGAPPTLPKRSAAVGSGAAATRPGTATSPTGSAQADATAAAADAAAQPGTPAAAAAEGGTVSPAPDTTGAADGTTAGAAETPSTARSVAVGTTNSSPAGASTGTTDPAATNENTTSTQPQTQP